MNAGLLSFIVVFGLCNACAWLVARCWLRVAANARAGSATDSRSELA